MAPRTARKKRTALASRRRLNTARPTEGRALLPNPATVSSPLVRLLVQPLERDSFVRDERA
jgi:hypothetical protein